MVYGMRDIDNIISDVFEIEEETVFKNQLFYCRYALTDSPPSAVNFVEKMGLGT